MTTRKDTALEWRRARALLRHVFWIGGATTAGKSTIATKLAKDFGLVHYSGDSHQPEHVARATAEEYPALYSVSCLQLQEFLHHILPQPPDMIRELMRPIFREFSRMVVEDLLAMPDDKAIVADVYFGEILGELNQLVDCDKAIFLVPTEAFHKAEYQRRFRQDWVPAFRRALENCPDAETVFMSGWAQYQLNYDQYVREECRKHGFPLLVTGGHSRLEESYKAVKDHFQLSNKPM